MRTSQEETIITDDWINITFVFVIKENNFYYSP